MDRFRAASFSAVGHSGVAILQYCQDFPVFLLDRWQDDVIFTSFSIVFQSYQDSGRVIMKGCAEPCLRLEDFCLR